MNLRENPLTFLCYNFSIYKMGKETESAFFDGVKNEDV